MITSFPVHWLRLVCVTALWIQLAWSFPNQPPAAGRRREISAVPGFPLAAVATADKDERRRILAPSSQSNTSTVFHVRGGAVAPLQSVGSVMSVLWRENPYMTAFLVGAVKAAAADAVAQIRSASIQKKEAHHCNYNVRRTVSFVLYGAIYQGMAQEYIYNNLYTQLFGAGSSLKIIAKKVMFDAVVHNPLLCIPMAYMVKSLVFRDTVMNGLRNYLDDVLHHGLLVKHYALWMPVNFAIYAFVPEHFRITTMACVSFFWMIILSSVSSRKR